jgi:hypothetical protein
MGFLRSLKGARRGTGLIMALVAVAAVGAGVAGQASAGNAGQLGFWGEQGTTDGKLTEPHMVAAEESGSVFVSDRPARAASFRLQKFSSTGTFEGAVTIPTPNEEVFKAMAVDSTAHLIYLLREKPEGDPENEKAMAETILIYSTLPNPSSHLLEPPSSGPTSFNVPTDATHVIDNPTDMVLDTNNHELEIAGENRAEQYVLQRIGTAAGALGPRYTETTGNFELNELSALGNEPGALAIAPDGTSYVIFSLRTEQGTNTAVTFSQALTNPTKVAGFAAGAEPVKIERLRGGIKDGSGAQVAISPDGRTLYFKTEISFNNVEGSRVLAYAYSLVDGKSFAVYGSEAAEGHCRITNTQAGLAPVGETLFVLDQGQEAPVSAFGDKVSRFGPGGTECPAPSAADAIKEGSTVVTEAHKGSPVTFDASPSELGEWGESIESVTWNVTGPETFEKTAVSTEPGFALAVQHTFNQEGAYTVRMSVQFKLKAGVQKLLPFAAKPKPLTITAPTTVPAPTVAELSPAHGPAAGGNTVTIKGTGFTGANAVHFGANLATDLSVVSATEITVKAPAGTANGKVDVTVTTPEGGSSGTVEADKYTYDVPTQALSVTKAGTGTGTVTSAPAGINCGVTCSASFEQGKEVALTAVPASGSTFAGWGGACTGTAGCKVPMSAAKSVTATFNLIPAQETPPPTGGGQQLLPPGGGGSTIAPPKQESKAEKLAKQRQAARKKCKKLKGKAKTACVKKANAIGKPKKKKKKPAKKPAKKHAPRRGG